MAQKAAIKSRIKSINATKKITGAMKLIATVKLQKERNRMLKNREYAEVLKNTIDSIMSGNIDADNEYLKLKDNPCKLFVVFCSDLGLCGGYNINISKLADKLVSKDDYVYVVGYNQYKNFKSKFNVINDEDVSSDSMAFDDIKKVAQKALDMYLENKIGSVEILYTKFINNVSFEASSIRVLPSELDTNETKETKEVLLEPDANDILNNLIPMLVENTMYAKFLESKTSEQGSRRFAMENATDNAQELTDELLLAYNQARQAAITQEITEIVGGADAL